LLARKYRALKAASELSQNEAPWSEVVGDAFSDQSHLIREFRQFVGVTPTQLVSRPPLVMQMSIQRRRVIDTLPELIQIT
jgi:AraC-like DNA-binding protein